MYTQNPKEYTINCYLIKRQNWVTHSPWPCSCLIMPVIYVPDIQAVVMSLWIVQMFSEFRIRLQHTFLRIHFETNICILSNSRSEVNPRNVFEGFSINENERKFMRQSDSQCAIHAVQSGLTSSRCWKWFITLCMWKWSLHTKKKKTKHGMKPQRVM